MEKHDDEEWRGVARGGEERRRRWRFLLLHPAEHAMLTVDTMEKCVCWAIPSARGRARSILSVWK